MQKPDEKTKKREKRTHMTGEELKRIRLAIKFDPRDMCAVLVLPRRTYQDYEAGKRSIPESVANAAREAHRRNIDFMKRLPKIIDTRIKAQYPNGISSLQED